MLIQNALVMAKSNLVREWKGIRIQQIGQEDQRLYKKGLWALLYLLELHSFKQDAAFFIITLEFKRKHERSDDKSSFS